MPQGEESRFVNTLLLVLTTDETEDTSMVPLTVVSGNAVIESHWFLLSGNRLDPGETEEMVVGITNLGHRNLSYVEGNLFTEDSLITFPAPTGYYGTITMGGSSTNTGDPFEITASAATVSGYPVTLGLALSGGDTMCRIRVMAIWITKYPSMPPVSLPEIRQSAVPE